MLCHERFTQDVRLTGKRRGGGQQASEWTGSSTGRRDGRKGKGDLYRVARDRRGHRRLPQKGAGDVQEGGTCDKNTLD